MKSIRAFGLGLAMAALGLSGSLIAGAQTPGEGPGLGMGPHRPPMERAMGPHGDHGRWWNDARAIEKYKLTESQRKSMDDIYQQHRLTLVDLHATLEKAELGMEPMMQEDQPDEGKILSQIDRVAAARAELEKANARMLLELRRQLTPEQWKQLQADRAAHRENHGSDGAGARWHGRGAGQAGPGGQTGPGGQGGPGAPPPPGEEE